MILRNNAPYIHTELNAPYIYTNMMAALLPCALYAIFCYGIRAVILLAMSSILSLVAARVCDRLRGVAAAEYYDISAMVNGVVYALLLPPGVSLIVAACGVVLGELVIKQLFGGVGGNPVNTAAASALMMNLLCLNMDYCYIAPYSDRFGIDGLFTLRGSGIGADDTEGLYIAEILTGSYAGRMGTACCLMILIGIIFLVFKRIVRIEAPIAYIVTIIAGYTILQKLNLFKVEGLRELVVFMVSSGVLFAAAFMITDCTTVAQGLSGGIISGCFAGITTVILGQFTSDMVFICVPVLLTNYLVYTLEYLISSMRSRRKVRL